MMLAEEIAPFNTSDANSTATNFGLTIEGTDPVSFTDSDTLTNSAAFPVQPSARYGRMALDDIGGNSDTTLTIPLRAEFWDGSEFVVNDDDNRSTFSSSNICKQVIWTSNAGENYIGIHLMVVEMWMMERKKSLQIKIRLQGLTHHVNKFACG